MKLEDMPELRPLDKIEIEYYQNDQLKDKRYKMPGYFLDISNFLDSEGEELPFEHQALFSVGQLVNNENGEYDPYFDRSGILLSHIVSVKVLQE